MPGSTPRYDFTYPSSADPTNVPGNLETSLDQIDAIISGSYSGILASLPAPGIEGRVYYATDTGVLYFDTSIRWLSLGLVNTITGNVAAEAPGVSALAGSTDLAADAGHRHAMPGWGIQTDITGPGTVALAGSTGRFADAGHQHTGALIGEFKWGGWSSPPSGTLLCDGTAYSQTVFPALYSAIGGNWNNQGGASNPPAGYFRVPNMLNNVPVGAGLSYAIAQVTGNTTAALTVANLASHTHADSGHVHTDSGHNHSGYVGYPNIQHNHGIPIDLTNYKPGSTLGANPLVADGQPITPENAGDQLTGADNQQHQHPIPIGYAAIETGYAAIQYTGSGVPFSVMQPSVGALCVISYQ